jgi:hypothetical protein
MRINWNKIAKQVTEIEGKKKEVNIAQVKEVIFCTRKILSKYADLDIVEAIKRR